MKIDQVVYGRGDDGYDILGASVPSCGLTDQIVDLCQCLGTPKYELDEDNKPFLLQKVKGPYVLMACGRNGELDSLGRKTLFFHVFAVPVEYVKEKRISAYDLYRAGLFSDRCCFGKLSGVCVDSVEPLFNGDGNGFLELPAVVRCRRSLNMELVSLFSGKLVATSWATMSWSLLEGFDWYGIDESYGLASLPDGVSVYDIDGKPQRLAKKNRNEACHRNSEERHESKVENGMMKTFVYCLFGFMAGVGVGRVVWFDSDRSEVGEPVIREELESKIRLELTPKILAEAKKMVRLEVEEEVRKEYIEKETVAKQKVHNDCQRLVFDEKSRIYDFNAQMKKLDTTWDTAMIKCKGDPMFRDARIVFKKLQSYVEFVNGNFPSKKERKNNEY